MTKMNMLLKTVGILFLLLCSMAKADETVPLPKATGHLVLERLMLPAKFRKDDGSSYVIHLDAIIVRPDDDRPHPLALINHGHDPHNYKLRYVDDFKQQTIELARRGWVAVVFSRRGYGHSEGDFMEGHGGLRMTTHDYIGQTKAPLDDIHAVIDFMRQQPYVDNQKMISIGHSGGGYYQLALAADPPKGLMAAINFAGATRVSEPNLQFENSDSVVRAAASFGQTARIPMLWIYAENDTYSPIELARQMLDAFVGRGGNAELIQGIWYGSEGHLLFLKPEGIPIWTPYVDRFLQQHGLVLLDGLISTSGMREIDHRQ